MKNYKKENRCIDCGKETVFDKAIRCLDCYKLLRHKNIKINKCIDCGAVINLKAKRCKPCDDKKKRGKPGHLKYPLGYKNNWSNCSKCGKKTSRSTSKLCGSCYIGSLKNKHPHNYKGGRPHCPDCNKLVHHGSIRCHSCASKLRWSDPEYRDRTVKATLQGLLLRPNKPETVVLNLLNQIVPNKFRYTGDGQVVIGGFNPDFTSIQNKQLIEVYGDYWHNIPKIHHKDQGRVKVYAEHGYKLLIIWERELQDLNKVIKKIQEFSLKDS
jgi:very-short-patch-repair endonuclease